MRPKPGTEPEMRAFLADAGLEQPFAGFVEAGHDDLLFLRGLAAKRLRALVVEHVANPEHVDAFVAAVQARPRLPAFDPPPGLKKKEEKRKSTLAPSSAAPPAQASPARPADPPADPPACMAPPKKRWKTVPVPALPPKKRPAAADDEDEEPLSARKRRLDDRRPLVLSGASLSAVNGTYKRVDALPKDALQQPNRGFPLYQHSTHPQIFILHIEDRWWISHYQPSKHKDGKDYYHAPSRPWKWRRCADGQPEDLTVA